jgi:hypothetical protein
VKGPPKEKDKSRAPVLETVGTVFRDTHGQLFYEPVHFTPINRGGRPRKELRDVSLTLHHEALTSMDGFTKTEARAEIAKLFSIADEKRHVSRIIKATTSALATYPDCVVIAAYRDGKPTRIMMSLTLGSVQRGGALRIDGKGFVVKWGDKTAAYGNVKATTEGWKPAPPKGGNNLQ